MSLPAVDVLCPYCGEPIQLLVEPPADDSAGEPQRYIEDCSVCCQPIEVVVEADTDDGEPRVHVSAGNE